MKSKTNAKREGNIQAESDKNEKEGMAYKTKSLSVDANEREVPFLFELWILIDSF